MPAKRPPFAKASGASIRDQIRAANVTSPSALTPGDTVRVTDCHAWGKRDARIAPARRDLLRHTYSMARRRNLWVTRCDMWSGNCRLRRHQLLEAQTLSVWLRQRQ